MKIGDKLVYGFNDRKHSIKCTFKKYKITKSGEVLIYAASQGGMIVAPWEMFKKAQKTGIANRRMGGSIPSNAFYKKKKG